MQGVDDVAQHELPGGGQKLQRVEAHVPGGGGGGAAHPGRGQRCVYNGLWRDGLLNVTW